MLISQIRGLRIYRPGKIRDQLREFVRSVNTETTPMISGVDGKNALEIVNKVYEKAGE